MPEKQATFTFPTFNVTVEIAGYDEEADESYYKTAIHGGPEINISNGGFIVKGLPILQAGARAAVSQLRRLLAEGPEPFLEEYRRSPEGRSFRNVRDLRVYLLSYRDMAAKLGDQALAEAEAQLAQQEAAEYKNIYGKEKTANIPLTADASFDFGAMTMDVSVMGRVGGLPLWGVTVRVPGTDLHANSIIAVDSPLAIHAADAMLENLSSVLSRGVDRYLAEEIRAKRTPITPEKRSGTEMLYAVASTVGMEAINAAKQQIQDDLEETVENLEQQHISDMEARIAEYRKRKPKA